MILKFLQKLYDGERREMTKADFGIGEVVFHPKFSIGSIQFSYKPARRGYVHVYFMLMGQGALKEVMKTSIIKGSKRDERIYRNWTITND